MDSHRRQHSAEPGPGDIPRSPRLGQSFQGLVPLAARHHRPYRQGEQPDLPAALTHPPGKLEPALDQCPSIRVPVGASEEGDEVVVGAKRCRREVVLQGHLEGVLEENGRLLVAALELQQDGLGVQSLGELLRQAEPLGETEGELDAATRQARGRR